MVMDGIVSSLNCVVILSASPSLKINNHKRGQMKVLFGNDCCSWGVHVSNQKCFLQVLLLGNWHLLLNVTIRFSAPRVPRQTLASSSVKSRRTNKRCSSQRNTSPWGCFPRHQILTFQIRSKEVLKCVLEHFKMYFLQKFPLCSCLLENNKKTGDSKLDLNSSVFVSQQDKALWIVHRCVLQTNVKRWETYKCILVFV